MDITKKINVTIRVSDTVSVCSLNCLHHHAVMDNDNKCGLFGVPLKYTSKRGDGLAYSHNPRCSRCLEEFGLPGSEKK